MDALSGDGLTEQRVAELMAQQMRTLETPPEILRDLSRWVRAGRISAPEAVQLLAPRDPVVVYRSVFGALERLGT